MRFTAFHIKNFKGIRDLTLKFNSSSKVYTLVGLNESGKTSILEAINSFANVPSKEVRHTLIPKSEKLNFNGTIEISADLEFHDADLKDIEKHTKDQGYLSARIGKSLHVARRYNFANSHPTTSEHIWTITFDVRKIGSPKFVRLVDDDKAKWNLLTEYIQKKFYPPIVYYPNFLFDFPEKIYLDKVDQSEDSSEPYYNVVQDVLYSISQNLTIKDHLLSRLENPTPSNEESLDLTVARMSSKVSMVVFKAWEKLFQRGKKEIVIRHGSEMHENKRRFFLQFKLKEGADQFSISERSLGFKWFFTFLLFTEFRKNRVTDRSEPLFLLDEPASNLHSTAQKNLLNTFRDLITKSYLIYTTHSHHLVNPDWLDGAFIVRNKAFNYDDQFAFESENTDVEAIQYKRFAAAHPDQRTFFQPILDVLDYQPGLLEEIPSIVITEGKNDYYTLRYINEVLFASEFKIHLYPGNGADRNSQVLALYLAWSRNFKILLDGDKAGIKAKDRYLKEFGLAVENHIVTLTDINGDFTFAMEDLFAEEEKILITQLTSPTTLTFDKSRFNLSIQNLLLHKEPVDLSDSTLKKFRSIFQTLTK